MQRKSNFLPLPHEKKREIKSNTGYKMIKLDQNTAGQDGNQNLLNNVRMNVHENSINKEERLTLKIVW